MKTSLRSIKLATTVKELLPPIINRFVSPDEVGLLTVAAIEISGDLGVADIFVRSIGAPGGFVKKLRKLEGKIGHELNKSLDLRRAMKLRFKIDGSVYSVEKIESFLNNS